MNLIKNKQYQTYLKTVLTWYQYSELTCEDGDHEDAMLVPNKRCRTLAPSSYTNNLHVVNL